MTFVMDMFLVLLATIGLTNEGERKPPISMGGILPESTILSVVA